MFHVRNLLTQSNLSLARNFLLINKYNKYSTNNITNNKLDQKDSKSPFVSEDTVNLSDSCIKRLKELENTNKYLRVLVDSGGCSGLEYKFSLDSSISKEDKVIEREGCKILIDQETLNYIKGSTLDYYEELIRTGFRIINNPNSEHACSCGTSFSIKI